MNWLTNLVRPKIRALVGKPDVPENLWTKCPNCDAMIFHRDLETNLHVCQHCGYHMRLEPAQRLALLFDGAKYETIELPDVPADPLRFRAVKRYSEQLREYQSRLKAKDALVVGHGTIGGVQSVAAVFDFRFLGGSMGLAAGEGFLAAARLAVLQKAPLIAVSASGGARMQEGILALMQMPRTVIGVQMVREAGLPYIVILTDPTTGGVTASFAMLGDIHIAEKGALIGFTGPRVIEETIRQSLPEGFQRAEYLEAHGMVDVVVERKDLKPTLERILDMLTNPSRAVPIPSAEPAPVIDVTEEVEARATEAQAAQASEETAEAETLPAEAAEERS